MRKISLSGIKPTGTPHLGNYLGMIRPALDLAKDYKAFYFIADAHALNQVRNADELKRMTFQSAATLLALGLNPEEVEAMRRKYLRGGFGYGEVKEAVFDVLERTFGTARTRYEEYVRDRPFLDRVLQAGAGKARSGCAGLMNRVREAVGFRRGEAAHRSSPASTKRSSKPIAIHEEHEGHERNQQFFIPTQEGP
jgi:tryptophanyl-tRNA synthetase